METVSKKIKTAYEALESKQKRRKNKYFLLYESIKGLIVKAQLPAEIELSPTRLLAESLSLSRSTVIKAYELLGLEGYIVSKQGSGYTVKAINARKDRLVDNKDSGIIYPDISQTATAFLKYAGQLNTTDDKSVGFRPGLPPLDIFPVNQWKNLSNSYWRYIKSSALSYSPSSGNEQLKKSLSSYLNLSRGIKCDSSQIIIVSGSLQSLYLLGNVILNPGDSIVVEDPTFPNVKSIFSSLRAKMLGIQLDEEGIQIKKMQTSAHKKAKLLHLTPSNHYPKGIQMSMQRRKEVLSWANKNNAFIIENDYEHEVNNYEDSLPSLFDLDKQSRTIFLGTFNRLLHPSIRLGYMVLPPYLIPSVEALMKQSHRFVAPSIQVVLQQFIEKKYIYSHIKKVVEIADTRKKNFITRHQELLSNEIAFEKSNVRSLHLLGKINGRLNDEYLQHLFADSHILVHPYSKCFIGEEKEQGLIYGYSSVLPHLAKTKLQKMSEILNR